ncbi:MAG: thioredoxin family protein [Deferribacterales bacterium]|jgi:small redox-active disulfide protein 2
MEIKVLGTGCKKCLQTKEMVDQVIKEQGADAFTTKVEDVQEIMKAGVMMTPAIVIDGEVKCSGKIPSREEIISWL